jgi:uncharacterized repeat protein (TIGR01451 family)
LTAAAIVFSTLSAEAIQPPAQAPLPNLDQRTPAAAIPRPSLEQTQAAVLLRGRIAKVKVDFDPVIGSPRSVSVADGFLSGPDGEGKSISKAAAAAVAPNDPHRATKAFLTDHRQLFGHGSEALAAARVQREFTAAHNGMKTVVWEQRVDGVPVFEAVLISHTTGKGELVSLSSQFVPAPDGAANRGVPGRAAVMAAPAISAAQAVKLAAENLGEQTQNESATAAGAAEAGPEQNQKFRAPFLRGESRVKLIWVPMDKDTLRLCWDVELTGRQRNEMYRLLIDAQSGAVVIRRCLTEYISDATYRVFTSDSPSPFSPGHPTPLTNQPPFIARSLVTWAALDTNASPAGWINDGCNETLGNNVDAHTDLNDDDAPDLPRPVGSPFRVFDFPLDLTTQAPSAYRSAAVAQLFYVCNWMHDKLYQLGFTEAAGNFQSNNFGRGGLGNDALQADAQDGGGTDNANMSTPSDGFPPRMQMYVFSGPALDRDGDFDVEIVLHEYTHGLSNRRVGGGVGLSASQSRGMGEGWSDWYGLTLLSEAGDNVNGNYAAGGYATYQFLSATFQQNYYFGIRRYPYSTDLTKNPLTFKDIDPGQASSHASIPKSPVIGGGGASEVHNQGEVWCVALWEARANLIAKHGFAVGNQLILQLVTDGMNLSPANPNFLQARDAIIQADLVLTGGANRNELWAAFAKRGMGASATSPSSSTTAGVHESFDLPDDLSITPGTGFTSRGPVGGPFTPNAAAFTLTNTGAAALTWTMVSTTAWLNVLMAGGATLTPGGPAATVTVSVNGSASNLPMGVYSGAVRFTNLTSGISQGRQFVLRVGQPDYFTELFEAGDNDLDFSSITFTPDGSPGYYNACRGVATNFFTEPAGGTNMFLASHATRAITVSGLNQVSIYGRSTNRFYLSSDGHLTFDVADSSGTATLANHFARPRVSALFSHLHPGDGGRVMYQELSNRVAITFENIPNYDDDLINSFQIELFFDGRIRLCYLGLGSSGGLVGLSAGLGVPAQFVESDLSTYGSCVPPLLVMVPPAATEGAGILAGQGSVRLPLAMATNVTVSLASSDTNEVAVPASIVMLAGQTNATFDVTVVNDGLLDGTQTANISVAAPGFDGGSASIAVHDNETATLFVNLPANATEGGGSVTGLVWISAVPADSVSVNLSSSDVTELQVPSSVSIPAGQTSAVFMVAIVDDPQIDNSQPVTVTAQVQNWTAGSAFITVLDNENLNLIVSVPYYEYEDAGTLIGAGSVQLSGTLATNLVVSLISSDVTELTVPATVIIPAGQFNGSFNITLVNDFLVDGEQSVQIIASAPGFLTDSEQMYVTDVQSPGAPAVIAPPDLASNVPAVGAVLEWFTVHAGVTNDVFFGTSPSPGAAEFLGSTLGDNWTLPLLAPNTTYYWRIGVRNVGSNSSPVWRFKTRGLDHFDVSAVASPPLINQPFNVTVTARDELNRAITNFTGPVALRGGARSNSILQSPQHSLVSQTLNGYTYSLGYSFTPSENITVTAVRHYFGSKISIWTDAGVLLAAQPVTSVAGTWLETPLSAPVTLLTGTRYRVACYTALDQFYWREDGPSAFPHGTIDQSYTTTGDFFPTQFSVTRWWFADLRYTVDSSRPAPLTPTNTSAFTDGVWSGSVTVSAPATNMTVQAITPTGHFGQSNPFHVVASNQPPIVLTQPASQSVLTGAMVNLSVSVFGAPPITYQWRYNGGDLADATNATLTLANVITNQSGNYSVAVSNFFGATLSSNALLTIIALPPFFDDFEPGIDLTQWSAFSPTVLATNYGGTISGANLLWFGGSGSRFAISRALDASLGGTVEFYLHIANGGDAPWENADLPGEGIVLEYSTDGGASWTSFGLYDTSVYYSWTHIVADIPMIAQTGATKFQWRQLSNSGASFDHWALDNVSVISGPRPPIITMQPATQSALPGANIGFSVGASGSSPLFYQWQRDGTNLVEGGRISGTTTTTLSIMNGAESDSGIYSVVVSNTFGTATSTNAALQVSAVDNFAWGFIGSPQIMDTPFTVTIFARNSANAIVTNFSGTVALIGSAVPVAISPTVSGSFTNGVWSGPVTVLQPATNLVLRAADAFGHRGDSLSFDVVLINDLSVAILDEPDPVANGALLTNVITAFNAGPTTATSVSLTNFLPPSVTFVSAQSSQGGCVLAGGRVECALGGLVGGAGATVTVVTRPAAVGSITNRVAIGRAEADGYAGNNAAESVTAVITPSLRVFDAGVIEGQSGLTPLVFNVRLFPASPTNVSVHFATADGTALAGSDYASTNGDLFFAPGQTNQTITVMIFGDTVGESTEIFSVNLTSSTNAGIADATGVGTIFNDDLPPDVYLRSTVGPPWDVAVNETAMNRVFGTNNWQDLRFETVTPAALFTPATRFIYMEGSDATTLELQSFLTANLPLIQNWVAAGGRLLLNAAPNEGTGMSFGFGVTLLYPDLTSAAGAVDLQHLIVTGPFTPGGVSWSGTSFGHATVSGTNLTALITNTANGRIVLAQQQYGAGLVLFGGMTTDNWHSPQPQAANLRANILSYTAGFNLCTNCAPFILTQPTNRMVFAGGSATFSVLAAGSSPLTYQWRRAGTNLADGGRISGTTGPTLAIANCADTDTETNYSVVVSNAFGSITSSNAALLVTLLPFITAQPVSQNAETYTTVTLSVSASGPTPLTYRWRRNGTNLINGGRFFGVTNATMFISGILDGDAGLYSVAVSNPYGTVISSNATITTRLVNHFVWAPILSPQGTNLDFAVSVSAATSYFNQLDTNFAGPVTLSASINGTGNAVALTPTVSGTFTNGVWTGSVRVTQLASNVVLRAVDTFGDSGYSAPFNVQAHAPLRFTVEPTNQFVLPGTNVTLVALAGGTGPVRYQWRFEGTNILDATNASYSFNNANLTNHHGNFSVVASDNNSTLVSSDAFIYVLVRPGVVTHITSPTVLQGGNATFSLVATGAPPLWYRWIKGGSGYATTSVPELIISNIQASTVLRVTVTNAALPTGAFSPGPTGGNNVLLTMLADVDGDGLWDSWEMNYFGAVNTTNNPANALEDPDGDGMNNRDEYRSGTIPIDALSVLKIVLTATNADVLQFVAQTNLSYTVQSQSKLTAPAWINLTSITASALVRTVQLDAVTAPFEAERYFRVVTPGAP